MTPIEETQQLYSRAREAKREEARHRRLSRARMEDLQRFCDYYGIELQTIKAKTEERHGPAERQH